MIIYQKGGDTLVLGVVSKDPEVKEVGDKFVTKFSVRYGVDTTQPKNESGYYPAKYMNIDAWGEEGIYAKELLKGDTVAVFGNVSSREYNDKTYWTLRAGGIIAGIGAVKRMVQSHAAYVGGYEQSGTTYTPPTQQSDYAMLEGDDAQLPF